MTSSSISNSTENTPILPHPPGNADSLSTSEIASAIIISLSGIGALIGGILMPIGLITNSIISSEIKDYNGIIGIIISGCGLAISTISCTGCIIGTATQDLK